MKSPAEVMEEFNAMWERFNRPMGVTIGFRSYPCVEEVPETEMRGEKP